MDLVKGATLIVVSAMIFAYYMQSNSFMKPSIVTEHLDSEYDYIVVGGGAAGSVIAARISEDRDNKVLLLEAGGHFSENPLVPVPSSWISLQHTDFDWSYYTEPQKYSHFGFEDRRSYWPRGRVLGGSSTINGVHYTRGSRFDFDEWAENGCEGWSYKEIHPYFLKSEDIQIEDLKSSPYHSTGGPVAVAGAYVPSLTALYLKAGVEMGYNITDYNGRDQEGFNKIQMMVRNGVRSGIAMEYLGNTANRPNLHIALRSFVTKIEINEKKATGVFVIRDGRKVLIKAKKEIIISAGAINSPQLLMLSGIGPKDDLAKFDIDVEADLPVGQNLQDHLIAILPMKINQSLSITKTKRESMWSKLQYALFGGGPLGIGGADGQAFFHIDKKNRGKKWPDIQLVTLSSQLYGNHLNLVDKLAKEYTTQDPDAEGFVTAICPTRPHSRGVIKLQSVDPFDYPSIDPQYLADPRDIKDFISGIRFWEKFIETPTMKSLGATVDYFKLSVCSQHQFRSDAYWECFIRHLAPTTYHPCCTCKMGPVSDPSSVVDSELRVKGIKGLRVADSSIFPSVTSGNTQAPTVMVAEKISDIIRGIDSVNEIRNKHIID